MRRILSIGALVIILTLQGCSGATKPINTPALTPASSIPSGSSSLAGAAVVGCDDTSTDESIKDEVIRLTNAERTKASMATLPKNSQLSDSAQANTISMACSDASEGRYSYIFDPSTMKQRVNVAVGQATAEAVVAAWMASADGRAKIINPNFIAIGVGYVARSGNKYWTQVFMMGGGG